MRIGFFDTETTDLVENRIRPLNLQPEIIELYIAVAGENGTIFEELETLVKPRLPVKPEQIKHTPVDQEMVKNAPSFPQVSARLRTLIESCDRMVAQNAQYDRDMVEIEFARLGETVRWPRMICTIEQSSIITGRRMNLTNLHIHFFGTGFKEAHRAKPDTEALMRIYYRMVEEGYIQP